MTSWRKDKLPEKSFSVNHLKVSAAEKVVLASTGDPQRWRGVAMVMPGRAGPYTEL